MGDQALGLTPRKRLDTGCAIHIFASGIARIDIGDDGLAATAFGIEIGVEDTGLASELQLACAVFAEIRARKDNF